MSDDVREVKSRIDIAELIGDYVQLRRRGASLWGLCPFHSEKTPSFSVSPERGTFHCFGCGKGGDAFSFLMEIEGLDFREALTQLADRAGVKLTPRAGRAAERSGAPARNVRNVLEEALKYFRSCLVGPGGEAARSYLARRSLGNDEWSRFELGWAPASWDALSKHLASQGVAVRETIDAGLVSEGDRGTYDRFRGRIIFPVRDEMAKIAGFGGRLIDGEGAKYVNSPEGDLFNKRRLLYLLHEAKRTIRERKRIILTEGYMDAIRAHTAGFTETVASLGTALTEEQASLVKRFADLCYIVYDADGAGQEAAIRGMYILQRARVEVRVVMLPEGRDPDDVLSEEGGAEAFERMLKKALPLPLYHVHARRRDLRTPGRQQAAREDVLSSLATLATLDLAEYIPAIAKGFGVLQHELLREIESRRRGLRSREEKREQKSAIYEEGIREVSSVYIDRTLDLECGLCSLLWQHETLRGAFEPSELLPLFTDEATAGIASALLTGETPDELDRRWREIGESACPNRLARGDAVVSEGELQPDHVPKIVETLRTNALRRRYEGLKPLVLSEEASEAEIAEYIELARKLKGGVR
ncbi:DNA primase [Synergistaceae bacterium OttesenSCG-928-I11]|nr:DNA primase [Synergistaceae bacterium OttesenSCG-928-I11]